MIDGRKEYTGPDRRKSGRDALVSEIACAVREEIACLTVPEAMHHDHHEFIGELLEEQRAKRERSEKIKTQVFGWGIVTFLTGVGTGVYNAAIYLREHLK